jgi:hypothetical protein
MDVNAPLPDAPAVGAVIWGADDVSTVLAD